MTKNTGVKKIRKKRLDGDDWEQHALVELVGYPLQQVVLVEQLFRIISDSKFLNSNKFLIS